MKRIKHFLSQPESAAQLILFAAILLRLAFNFVNFDANDNHWEFAYLINFAPEFPAFNYCHECFQPPIFYWLIAKFGKLINYYSLEEIRFIMQCVSTVAGIFLCFIIYKWHRLLQIPVPYKNLSLAFWLFNTNLLVLNCSATNDTLLIALVSGSIYHFYNYVKCGKTSALIWSLVLAMFSPIIKGSGLALIPFFIWISIVFNFQQNFKPLKLVASIFVLIVMAWLIDFSGGYAKKRKNYGDALIINCEKPIKAGWDSDQGNIGMRYGVKNIKSAYLNFPFFSLLQTPYNINSGDEYPLHRTNFWTQIYGQFYSVQFLNHPSNWIHHHPDYENIVKGIFVLGLGLFFIFLLGFVYSFKSLIPPLRNLVLNPDLNLISLAIVILFLALNITYSLQYRDFSFIKMAYLFPCVLGLMGLFATGLKCIPDIKWLKITVLSLLWIIILFNFYDYILIFKKCL